jgi:hypothetical protein
MISWCVWPGIGIETDPGPPYRGIVPCHESDSS